MVISQIHFIFCFSFFFYFIAIALWTFSALFLMISSLRYGITQSYLFSALLIGWVNHLFGDILALIYFIFHIFCIEFVDIAIFSFRFNDIFAYNFDGGLVFIFLFITSRSLKLFSLFEGILIIYWFALTESYFSLMLIWMIFAKCLIIVSTFRVGWLISIFLILKTVFVIKWFRYVWSYFYGRLLRGQILRIFISYLLQKFVLTEILLLIRNHCLWMMTNLIKICFSFLFSELRLIHFIGHLQ